MDVSYFSLVVFFLCTPITATPAIQDTDYAVLIGGDSVDVWFPGETSPCTAPPTIPALPEYVLGLSAAVLGNMIIYCGGLNENAKIHNKCYSYTVGSSRVSWDRAPDMIHGRIFFTLTGFKNLLIAVGGYDGTGVEVYKDGRWSEVVDWELSTQKWGHCAVKYGDSKLVLTGGVGDEQEVGVYNLVEQLDTITGEWTQMPSMNYDRYGHSCVSFRDDIIVAGGYLQYLDSEIYLDSAERFSPATGNWEVLPGLNSKRYQHSMGVLNGYPTIMGGEGYFIYLKSTEYWNGTQWVYGKQLQNSRAYNGAVVLTCD